MPPTDTQYSAPTVTVHKVTVRRVICQSPTVDDGYYKNANTDDDNNLGEI